MSTLFAAFGVFWAIKIVYYYTLRPFVDYIILVFSDNFDKEAIKRDIERLGIFKYKNQFICYKTERKFDILSNEYISVDEVYIFPTVFYNSALIVLLFKIFNL